MSKIKDLLGNLPYTAELYWQLRQKGQPTTVGMNLTRLVDALPEWIRTTEHARAQIPVSNGEAHPKKRILIFGMIHYWIEYTTLLALAYAAMGHEVTLSFLPYAHWRYPINRFDLRRQNAYIRECLKPAENILKIAPLLTAYRTPHVALPDEITNNLRDRAFRDTQYALLTEEVEVGSDLYNLRLARDTEAAEAVFAHLQAHPVDAVITPNGSILEFGVVYQAARHFDIPIATFEFGEQNYRMWMAQNDDVMLQDTTALWNARGEVPLTDEEWKRIRTMFEARQGAHVWETFERQWQTADSKGAQQVRADLGLDDRPLAFLPTNVLGDSLTLGRQLFTGMTEWIRSTLHWFGAHPEYQLVVRVHPGEQAGWGPSTFDLLKASFDVFPDNVRVLPADYKINSYDLVDAARVGLVYTTTMGMEMAMSGKPVIVVGQTHYRGKGFTHDPEDWPAFEDALSGALLTPEKFTPDKTTVTAAWTYAYRFFFEYPQPFPWHIQHFWDCLAEWPLDRVLSKEGMREFGDTFETLMNVKPLF